MGRETLVASVMKQNTAGGRYTPSRRVRVAGNTTGRGIPRLVAFVDTTERVTPLRVASAWNKTRRRGFPPSRRVCVKGNTARRGKTPSHHVCVEEDTTEKGFPPSHRVCVERNTTGEGFPPPRRVCVERNTTAKGFPPSRRVCVEANTTGEGFPPFVVSVSACVCATRGQNLVPASWGNQKQLIILLK